MTESPHDLLSVVNVERPCQFFFVFRRNQKSVQNKIRDSPPPTSLPSIDRGQRKGMASPIPSPARYDRHSSVADTSQDIIPFDDQDGEESTGKLT